MPDEPELTDPNRISNQLPSQLVVCGHGNHRFVLAALEVRPLDQQDWKSFGAAFRALAERRIVGLDVHKEKPRELVWILFAFCILVVPPYLIAGIVVESYWYWLAGGAGLAAAVILLILLAVGQWENSTWSIPKFLVPLLLVLIVGIAAPASSVYFAGDVTTAVDSRHDLTLIGRTLQAVLIAIASLLPALLYFLFDRMKVETLRGNFVRDIFRFDPCVGTVSDVRARYGSLMDELYGQDDSTAGRRHGSRSQPGRRAPVWVATVVITIGWILCLLNPEVETPLTGAGVLALFEPHATPVVFAFLGAYVFALQYLLRSYLRADLRPKSYTHVTVRIFVAVIFAWVLEQLFASPGTSNEALLVAAFVVGVLPETLLVRLQETARRVAGKTGRLSTLVERYPLTDLEGIDIYDRTRLVEEGVGNIEGLAHHNLPELMMQTRIPIGRLVYWTDQAILFLHVATSVNDVKRQTDARGNGEEGGNGSNWTNHTNGDRADGEASNGTDRLRILQEHGIHTATDLRNAYSGIKHRAGQQEAGARYDRARRLPRPARI